MEDNSTTNSIPHIKELSSSIVNLSSKLINLVCTDGSTHSNLKVQIERFLNLSINLSDLFHNFPQEWKTPSLDELIDPETEKVVANANSILKVLEGFWEAFDNYKGYIMEPNGSENSYMLAGEAWEQLKLLSRFGEMEKYREDDAQEYSGTLM